MSVELILNITRQLEQMTRQHILFKELYILACVIIETNTKKPHSSRELLPTQEERYIFNNKCKEFIQSLDCAIVTQITMQEDTPLISYKRRVKKLAEILLITIKEKKKELKNQEKVAILETKLHTINVCIQLILRIIIETAASSSVHQVRQSLYEIDQQLAQSLQDRIPSIIQRKQDILADLNKQIRNKLQNVDTHPLEDIIQFMQFDSVVHLSENPLYNKLFQQKQYCIQIIAIYHHLHDLMTFDPFLEIDCSREMSFRNILEIASQQKNKIKIEITHIKEKLQQKQATYESAGGGGDIATAIVSCGGATIRP